jgi:hypothetical protein
MILLVGLLVITTGMAATAFPPELELEIVTAPGYISTPCPIAINNPNQSGNPGNPAENSIDHAAHHRTNNRTEKEPSMIPLALDDATRLELVKQLTEAERSLSVLIKVMESGTK